MQRTAGAPSRLQDTLASAKPPIGGHKNTPLISVAGVFAPIVNADTRRLRRGDWPSGDHGHQLISDSSVHSTAREAQMSLR